HGRRHRPLLHPPLRSPFIPPRPPPTPLFPYTTLFRSDKPVVVPGIDIICCVSGDAGRPRLDVAKRLLVVGMGVAVAERQGEDDRDRKSTRLNSSHLGISYAVFCLKKKKLSDVHKLMFL